MWPPGFSGGLHRSLEWVVLIPGAFGQARGCHRNEVEMVLMPYNNQQ